MRHFRAPTTLIAVACVTGLLATDVRAQLFRRPSPPPTPATQQAGTDAAADSGIAPGTPSRGARQLLRNGIDYLDQYGDPARALSYFKDAKRQEATLSASEKKVLDAAIARAQRTLAGTEASRTPIARSAPASSLVRDTKRSSLLEDEPSPAALASKPIKADRSVQTTSTPDTSSDEDQELAVEPRADTPKSPALVAEPAPQPEPLSLPEPPASLNTPGDAPAATQPPAAMELTILEEEPKPSSTPVLAKPAQDAAEPADTDLGGEPESSGLLAGAKLGNDGAEPADTEGNELPALDPTTSTDPDDQEPVSLDLPKLVKDGAVEPASSAAEPTPVQETAPSLPLADQAPSLPTLPDTDNIPEIRVRPIDELGPGTSRTADVSSEPVQQPLLVPPPAPRPIQRLEGVEVRDIDTANSTATNKTALPALPAETPSVEPSEPVVPQISRAEPGQTGRMLTDPRNIPAAPATAADELPMLPGVGSAESPLPRLPEPPAALPQPRNPAGPATPVDSLPQLPADPMPAPGTRSTPTVLPDAIPGQPQIQVKRQETLREVEELARRQTAESRDAIEPAPLADANGSRREDATADLPRAPAPTEARPIKPIDIPEEFVPLEKRNFQPNRKFWVAPAICHTPLYFQDAVLERYGQSVEQALGPHMGQTFSYPLDDPRQSIQRQQLLQPAYSAGMFALQILALPYNILMDPPWEAQYDLGYYRPGDPIPPDTTYLPTTGVGPPLRGRKY